MNKLNFRADVISSFGGPSSEVEELLSYNYNVFDHSDIELPVKLPLEDGSFVSAWERYSAETETSGPYEYLKDKLVQMSFPVKEGISLTEDYLLAVRQGIIHKSLTPAKGPLLNAPNELRIVIYQSLAGRIPLLITGNRKDFVTLVQTLTMKNEPVHVPDSMGACMVSGYNNWDRIRELKRQWNVNNPSSSDWEEEFKRIIPKKELYQDRFCILSNGSYSNVTSRDIGLPDEEWKHASFTIRREHECTHYFTRRLFGSMRNNLLDELIADYMGIVAFCGRYRVDWFLRFLGLEAFPHYREGGRLQNYRALPRKNNKETQEKPASQVVPQLSDGAFKTLQMLIRSGAENLEQFDNTIGKELRSAGKQSHILMALTFITLEELASRDSAAILQSILIDLYPETDPVV